MDAGRILGGLLASRGQRSGNGQVLGTILDGVAKITAAANANPRFPPGHHAPFERIVRESVIRHHQRGGRIGGPADAWVQLQPRSTPVPAPRHDHDDHHSGWNYNRRAELLILAMIMAAQADGRLDEAEQNQIIGQLQPLDRVEEDFLRRNFRRRHDVEEFVREIPNGMEYEVYGISLSAIHLDTQAEAHYLRTLAECMRMTPQEVNVIHHRFGAPPLY